MLLVTGQALVATGSVGGQQGHKSLRGTVVGGIAPSGIVLYDEREGFARCIVQVEDIMLPSGTVLDVFINADRIGTITLTPHTIHPLLVGGTMEPTAQEGKVVPAPAGPKVVFVRHGGRAILMATL
jgi:hypothetical protein